MTGLREALRAADYVPHSYSGRFMYGTRCVALDLASAVELVQVGYALGLVGFGYLPQARMDSMGTGVVLYWPGEAWTEEDEG